MTVANVALFQRIRAPRLHEETSLRADTSGQSISQLQMARRIFLYVPMKISSRDDIHQNENVSSGYYPEDEDCLPRHSASVLREYSRFADDDPGIFRGCVSRIFYDINHDEIYRA